MRMFQHSIWEVAVKTDQFEIFRVNNGTDADSERIQHSRSDPICSEYNEREDVIPIVYNRREYQGLNNDHNDHNDAMVGFEWNYSYGETVMKMKKKYANVAKNKCGWRLVEPWQGRSKARHDRNRSRAWLYLKS